MNERWFGYQHAFDHPVTVWITVAIGVLLAVAPALIVLAQRGMDANAKQHSDLWPRYFSWLALAPAMVVPVLAGAFWTILAAALLSLLTWREFARMTGAFRNRRISLVVVLGILTIYFAALDHWYNFFVAAWPLTTCAIFIAGLAGDQPKGYVQRTALGVMGFTLCGAGIGHFAYFANDANFRPMILMLVVGIQLNDVFAYCSGKLIGHRKLVPQTSPNKTWGGALGAVLLTTPLVAGLGHFTYRHTPLDAWPLLLGLGVLVSVLGQLGDLMLSAIKRDIGVKDTGHLIPGHGGLLDRFDSTLLVAPAAFHYVGYFLGIGVLEAKRVMSG